MAQYDVTMPTTFDNNQTNTTEPLRDVTSGAWSILYNAILIAITVVVMFSMGTSIQISHLKTILARPIGPIIGAVSQLILMPACCCGYALALSLPANIAIGMLLVGSTPGGAISNIVTFWSNADVILSVCMTTISTTLALGFLPLNMFIYSRFWSDNMTDIPYVNMVITVLYLWASVILGFFVGRKWPKTIPYFTKIGSLSALVLILVAGIVQGKVYPEVFDLTWQTYLAVFTTPIIGFLIGFLLSWIFCLGMKQKLAIGFETGIQNTALALTIIAITFPSARDSSFYSQYIILYSTSQVALGIGTVLGFWLHNFIRYRETPCTTKSSFQLTETVTNNNGTTSPNGTTRRGPVVEDSDDQIKGLWIIPDISSYSAWSAPDVTTTSTITDSDASSCISRSI